MNKRKKLEKFVRIFGETIVYDCNLRDYYKLYYGKVRHKNRITKEKKPILLKLIKVYREDNEAFFNQLTKSGLMKLACEQLIRENKMKRTYVDSNNWMYDGKLEDVMEYMMKIVTKAGKQKRMHLLQDYCKGASDEGLIK